jgi:hypothetical protein
MAGVTLRRSTSSFPGASAYGSPTTPGTVAAIPADEERRHLRLLAAGEVVAQDDGDLRLELHPAAQILMGRAGIEPATLGLKVPCSTS